MAAKKKAARKKAVKKAARKKAPRKKAPRRSASSRARKPARKKAAKKKAAKKKVARKPPRKALKKKAARKPAKKAPRTKAAKKKAARKPAKKAAKKKAPGRSKGDAARSDAARRAEAIRRQLSRAKVGTFDELFGTCSPEIQTIAHQLRELILEIIPDAQETVYLGWRIALYKKSSEICGIQPAGDRCNFYLTKGAYLHDSQGVLEGTGKAIRHVKVRSVVGMAAETIRDLLKQALEISVP